MPVAPSHILIVEDDAGLAQLFSEELAEQGFRCEALSSAAACLEWLTGKTTDLLLLDHALPDMTGSGLIDQLAPHGGLPPFVVITGHGDERLAVQFMKQGARDYLVKDQLLLDRLPAVVTRVLRELAKERELAAAEQALRESERRFCEVLERRVEQRTAELDAAYRELEAFSYSVSHDLRAPLRAIRGYADMLQEEVLERLDDQQRRWLQVVRGEAERMGQLIDDLLRFFRFGRHAIEPLAVDMTALVREVYDRLREQCPERSVEFRLSPLPLAGGDPVLLRQVWHNLVDNALKYTRMRVPAVIQVRGETQGQETVYSIEDNGIGFDMKYADKLFGVFQRLHSPSEFEGTGVGLALVHRIIDRHGGRAWAEAEPDRGARFHFSLPCRAATEDPGGPKPGGLRGEPGRPTLGV